MGDHPLDRFPAGLGQQFGVRPQFAAHQVLQGGADVPAHMLGPDGVPLHQTMESGDLLPGDGFSVDDDQNGTPVVSSPNATVTFDNWYQIVGVVDRTNNRLRIYNNGSEVGAGTDISTLGDVAWDRELQFPWAGSYDYDGLLDEVRISKVVRSACWIETEYNNQSSPSDFYSVGSEF